jgi:hypothetical protein
MRRGGRTPSSGWTRWPSTAPTRKARDRQNQAETPNVTRQPARKEHLGSSIVSRAFRGACSLVAAAKANAEVEGGYLLSTPAP